MKVTFSIRFHTKTLNISAKNYGKTLSNMKLTCKSTLAADFAKTDRRSTGSVFLFFINSTSSSPSLFILSLMPIKIKVETIS